MCPRELFQSLVLRKLSIYVRKVDVIDTCPFYSLHYRAIAKVSFVDYIKGGCELNLIVAIDFTVRSSDIINYYIHTYTV